MPVTSPTVSASASPISSLKGEVRLAFAGVDFQIRQLRGPAYRVPDNCASYALPFCSAPTLTRVRCALTVDPTMGLDPATAYGVQFAREADGVGWVRNGHVMARLLRMADGSYEAEAHVSTDERGSAGLLRFIAAAIVEFEGGLNLHAAAADVNGQAVAFTGRSGAGKTTAVNLSRAARCLAADQLTVYPYGQGYMAWALPWGNTANEALPSEARVLPLRAVLRVVRGRPETRVDLVQDPVQALFVVRDAVTVSDASLDAEDRRLSSCQRLCETLHVGHINTVLDQSTDEALRALPPVRPAFQALEGA